MPINQPVQRDGIRVVVQAQLLLFGLKYDLLTKPMTHITYITASSDLPDGVSTVFWAGDVS